MTLFLLFASQILVGTTVYDDDRERFEMMTNDECNLYVKWEDAAKLLPEATGREWYEWARTNDVSVMTIYGRQDADTVAKLKSAWGKNYLGNNIGEFAGFLYQDEKSYSKDWRKCRDLKDAHDWFVKELMAKPAANPDNVYSTSGSPLACYELEGGMPYICNEMYAVGAGNLAYTTAEARGASRRHGRDRWCAWLAHEWQTCWPRVPYRAKQKYDSLLTGLKELYVMGTSMMVLESGTSHTQAHPYTPPEADMREFSGPKQGYDGYAPRHYRETLREFYRFTKAHPRAEGEVEAPVALVLGNYDAYVGMTWDAFAIWGQHHLARTNANWRSAAPEFTWDALQERFFPRPKDSLRPYANGWLGGTPFGQTDVVNVDDDIAAGTLDRYRLLVFGGWNTMTPEIAAALRGFAARGGTVLTTLAQWSGRVDREMTDYTASDLVALPEGIAVTGRKISEDILMVHPNAPAALRAKYPAHLPEKFTIGEMKLSDAAEAVVTMGKDPFLVRIPIGKGAVYLLNAWTYPGNRNDVSDFYLDAAESLAREVPRTVAIEGPDARYINYSVIGKKAYFLNTDCVGRRSVRMIRGKSVRNLVFEPMELKEMGL